MSNPIRIGIIGYGNLGRGVESAISQNDDMTLVGIFTRRDPASIASQAQAYAVDEIMGFKDRIDVMILCGGSATDLPEQGPAFARHFNTVEDRKSTRLNSSHVAISYAVFCLKKKTKMIVTHTGCSV